MKKDKTIIALLDKLKSKADFDLKAAINVSKEELTADVKAFLDI